MLHMQHYGWRFGQELAEMFDTLQIVDGKIFCMTSILVIQVPSFRAKSVQNFWMYTEVYTVCTLCCMPEMLLYHITVVLQRFTVAIKLKKNNCILNLILVLLKLYGWLNTQNIIMVIVLILSLFTGCLFKVWGRFFYKCCWCLSMSLHWRQIFNQQVS